MKNEKAIRRKRTQEPFLKSPGALCVKKKGVYIYIYIRGGKREKEEEERIERKEKKD